MNRHEARRQRAKETQGGRCVPFFVVAEGTSRRYGGPQEGGWWYDDTEALDVFQSWTWRQALAIARKLREDWPTCPRGRGSVLGGTDVVIRLHRYADTIPTWAGRPSYE